MRALKHHGDDPDGGVEAVEHGAANLARHIGIIKEFGLNAVVAVNRFPADTDEEIATVRRLALELGAYSAAVNTAFEDGGEGARELAEAVVDAAEQPNAFEPVYPLDAPITAKIEAIAKRVYGADGIYLLPAAENDVKRFTEQGLDTVPICMAKTHLSLSHDPNAGQRADRLHGAGTGDPRLHGRRLAGRPLRRHADDARPVGDAGRVQRRHRRERPHHWPLLRPLAAGRGPAIVRTVELAAGLALLTARVAGRDDLAGRAEALPGRARAAGCGRRRGLRRLPGHGLGRGPRADDRAAAADGRARRRRGRARGRGGARDRARRPRRREGRRRCSPTRRPAPPPCSSRLNGGGDAAAAATERAARAAARL